LLFIHGMAFLICFWLCLQEGEDEEVGKWSWGELPSTGATTPATTPMVSIPPSQIGRNGNTNGNASIQMFSTIKTLRKISTVHDYKLDMI